jgi:hypothetical protein
MQIESEFWERYRELVRLAWAKWDKNHPTSVLLATKIKTLSHGAGK